MAELTSKAPLKLWNGSFYWYDADDMPKLVVRRLKEEYDPTNIVHGNIIPNPAHANHIVIFDMPEDYDFFASSFRGFLYDDGKIIGKLTWNIRGSSDVDDVSGTYTKTSRKLSAQGIVREKSGATDNFYFELKK